MASNKVWVVALILCVFVVYLYGHSAGLAAGEERLECGCVQELLFYSQDDCLINKFSVFCSSLDFDENGVYIRQEILNLTPYKFDSSIMIEAIR